MMSAPVQQPLAMSDTLEAHPKDAKVPPERQWLLKLGKAVIALGIFPYRIVNYRFEMHETPYKTWHYTFNVVLITAYNMFLIVRYILILYWSYIGKEAEPSGDLKSYSTSIILAWGCILAFKGHFHLMMSYCIHLLDMDDACMEHRNNTSAWASNLELGSQVDSALGRATQKRGRKINKRLTSFYIIFLLIYIARIIRRPNNVYHLTSLLPSGGSAFINLAKLLLGMLHIYMWCIQLASFNWLVCLILTHVQVANIYLKRLLISDRLLDSYSDQLRSWTIKARMYNKLRVLQREFNIVFRYIQTASIVAMETLITLNVLQAVQDHSLKAIFGAPTLFFILKNYLSALAQSQELSVKVLHSWKQGNNDQNMTSKWFKKYCRSAKPLYAENGVFGYIDEELLLTLLAIVIENSVTLLLGQNAI